MGLDSNHCQDDHLHSNIDDSNDDNRNSDSDLDCNDHRNVYIFDEDDLNQFDCHDDHSPLRLF